jgi:IS5 family transposase
MDEDWAYKELVDEHTNGECNCHDWLALQQVVAGRGSLRAVAGARRVFAAELDGIAAEGWELADPVPEEGPLRLLGR